MDFRFTEADEKFRQEVRDFLAKELRPGSIGQPWLTEGEKETPEWRAIAREFTRKCYQKGYLTMGWPKEYGGRPEVTAFQQYIWGEETGYKEVPLVDLGGGGVGRNIINFGTEEQKRDLLPKIKNGDIIFTEGMTEADAGSDLANLSTTAVEDGDSYIINGSKSCASGAHYADWLYGLVRTGGPDLPRHRGLSYFIIDLKSPGITIRPLENIAGRYTFCIVYFDNVKVPKSNLLGEKNRGWYMTMAAFEGAHVHLGKRFSTFRGYLDELVEYIKEKKHRGEVIPNEQIIRHRLAQMATEIEVGRCMVYKLTNMVAKGRRPTWEGSLSFCFGKDFAKRFLRLAMEILGTCGQLGPESKWAPLKGLIERQYLYTPPYGISGGTAEIQRNIIAQRGLELPRP